MASWTEEQDNLLKQMRALGISAKKIYETYGTLLGNRTESTDRICNRLDNIARSVDDIKATLKEQVEKGIKMDANQIRVFYEMKAACVQSAARCEDIKSYVKRL